MGLLLRFWLGLPLPPLAFLGLDPYLPSTVLRCASGTATRWAHRAIQLEGARLCYGRWESSTYLRTEPCSATFPPLVVPDITFPDPERATLWTLDFVVADSQGQMARLRGRRSGSPSIRATETGQVPPSMCCYTLNIAHPHWGGDVWGVGPGAQDFVKTLLRLRSARLPHVDQDDYAAAHELATTTSSGLSSPFSARRPTSFVGERYGSHRQMTLPCPPIATMQLAFSVGVTVSLGALMLSMFLCPS